MKLHTTVIETIEFALMKLWDELMFIRHSSGGFSIGHSTLVEVIP